MADTIGTREGERWKAQGKPRDRDARFLAHSYLPYRVDAP